MSKSSSRGALAPSDRLATSSHHRRPPRVLVGIGASVALRYLLLVIVSIILVFPFYWVVVSALKPQQEMFAYPPVFFPSTLNWANLIAPFKETTPYGQMFINSTIVSLLNIVGSLISCSLAAYGFGRLRFKGREFMFNLLLASMMVPFVVRLVPLFLLFNKLGWINTLNPLIVPAFLGTPFFIFILRQFYRTIPGELSDAAKIDGCSELGIWWRLMLPLTKPAMGAVAILSFQAAWSDYLAPAIFLNDMRKLTIMVGLGSMLSMPGEGQRWDLVMGLTALVTLPMVLMFLLFQRSFVQGMTLSGLKG